MSPYRRLLGYVLRYRRAFLLGFLCVIASQAIGLAAPWVLKYAIDDLTVAVTIEKVRFYAAALLGLAVLGGVFRFLQRRIIIGASRDIEYDLRNDFFAQLQRLDLAWFHQNRTGDLMSRATSDLGAVRQMIGPAVMYTATTVLTFIVAVILMVSIHPWLTLVSLIPLPLVSISVYYFGNVIHRRSERIQEQLADITAIAQEALSGVRVVRAYGQEPFEVERFRAANDEYVRRNRALIIMQGMYYPTMGLFMGIGALLVLWLGAREVMAQPPRLTVGELVAFNAYLMMLSWPMIAFGWVTNLLQRGMASWKRMIAIFETTPGIRGGGGGAFDPRTAAQFAPGLQIRGDVEFRNLTFAHGPASASAKATADKEAVLKNISAYLPAGSTTAIVGPTGSGKSTLLSLLPRLYDPPPGTVFIDGTDVRELPLDALRGAIGFVPQEPFLFGGTIADNVAFGIAPGPNERDEVASASAVARLDRDVADFPKGYDTMIGERGITLSGGQKQRTAIARALAVDPRILVLDDALSAVDTYTEDEILHRLRGVMRQRTSIIVSHRVSTVRDADQILVLDDGAIVERGTHDELVALNGQYAELYRKQLLEEELAAS